MTYIFYLSYFVIAAKLKDFTIKELSLTANYPQFIALTKNRVSIIEKKKTENKINGHL